MEDEISLGAEPRRRPGPDRRTVILVAASTLFVGASAALLITQPWRTEPAARLAATGDTCTVGYGSDLVVLAAGMTNPSATRPVTITGVTLAATTTDATQTGGPIDIVTADGCEHVLALRNDVVPPGGTVWIGLTVRSGGCRAVTLPVVVGSEDRSGPVEVSVGVPLPADAAPACSTTER